MFNFLKSKKQKTQDSSQMTEADYKKQFGEEASVGWDCIDRALEKIYGNQEPRHYGSIIKHFMGGPDPLDGSSIYDVEFPIYHRHIVSYGMSELYNSPDSVGNEFSGWGFEFTFRIVPCKSDEKHNGADNEPMWAINVMNNLGRYVLESKKWFDPYHFIPANGPLRLETETDITGVVFVPDTQLGDIDTPHGKVQFLQMVGVTQKELDWLFEDPKTTRAKELIERMREDNPMLITDLTRNHSYV